MGRLGAILLFVLLASGPAEAGAWLRDKDKGFTAVSATVFQGTHSGYAYKTSLYGEWGYRPKLTLGIDAEESHELRGHALIFGRIPIADFETSGRLAAEFGVGAHHYGTRTWAMYKATLSYGKGIQSAWGNGWLAIDAALEYRSHAALFRKLDFTAGLSSGRRFDPLLQIETSHAPGHAFYWSVRPSVMIRGPGKGNTWVLSAERNAGHDTTGVKLAFWRDF